MLLLLLACSPPTPPTTLPPAPVEQPRIDLSAPTPTRVWRALDTLTGAHYTLPASSLPKGAAVPGTFPLSGTWERTGRHAGRLSDFSFPLPFPETAKRPNYAPRGAKLFHGDEEIPYINDAPDIRGSGWYVEEGKLHVLSMEPPEGTGRPWVLKVPELEQTLKQLNYAMSGLKPEEFVVTELTIGEETRQGVHVPAPGVIGFDVAIPAGARLEFGAAMMPDPLGGESDGATASVTVDGESVWSASVETGDAFTDARVDLAKWAGRTVRIELKTEPGKSTDYDHVIFTSPGIDVPGRAPRRIVLIGIDTLRYDALSVHGNPRPTSPELDAWAARGLVLDRAYAPAPRTRPSFRTTLTGRYPIAAIRSPTIAEVLVTQGFRTAGFAANVHLVPRFGFNDGFETWHYENGARAEEQVDRALKWFESHPDEDAFVFLHIMDPHTFYNAPKPYGGRFAGAKPPVIPEMFNRWELYKLMEQDRLTAEGKAWARARYDEEVAYVSAELDRFLKAVNALPGQTMTSIIADHGEEFWDHGAYEHNHSLYNELVHVMFWMLPPGGWGGGPHRSTAPVGLIDVVPTLLDFAGVAAEKWPVMDGRSLRPLLDGAQKDQAAALEAALHDRPMELGHLMFERERWGVVHQGWKYILHTTSGREEVYDLNNDPKEQTDLVGQVDEARLMALRAALAEATRSAVQVGYRVRLSAPSAPFTLRFDAPVTANVIDPEASLTLRANLEWGEKPATTMDEVGRVIVDGGVVRFIPGPKAGGQTLYVACEAECPAGVLEVADVPPVALTEGRVTAGTVKLSLDKGYLLLPTLTEAEMLAAPDIDTHAALKELGYIDGD